MSAVPLAVYELSALRAALSRQDMLHAVEQALISHADGRIVAPPPGVLLFENPPGDCHIKSGYAKDGSVFVVNDEARLVRLDASTGDVIWQAEMPYFDKDKAKKHKAITAHYGPVLAGGRIVVASGDGPLRLFDPTNGTMVYSVDIPGGAASAPVLAQGMLFVVGGNGQLHAFR